VGKESVCGHCDSPTENVLCNDCIRVFRSNIEIAKWLLEQLGITASRQAVMGQKYGGKSAETPDPVHWGAAAAKATLQYELDSCATAMARDLRLLVGNAIEFLDDHIHDLAIWMPAGKHSRLIDAAVSRAMKAIDCEPPKSIYQAPCDVTGCEGEWWTIPGDPGYVSCYQCGITVSREGVIRRLNEVVDGNLYSITEIALIASMRLGRNIDRDQVYQLTQRRLNPLQPRGRAADGVKLYSIADVEPRLRRHRK
jgi:hypothetical protein